MTVTVATQEARRSFYPTPPELAKELLKDLRGNIRTVLEPSAGTGNLLYALAPELGYRNASVDCIELDPALRGILQHNFSDETRRKVTDRYYEAIRSGDSADAPAISPAELEDLERLYECLDALEIHIVHDDFLTYETHKHYDLIVMNPPFSCGDAHLLKAISMMERTGGQIRCILNAETLRNPYTNRRKLLIKKLEELEAVITYKENAFTDGERSTDVEIAMLYLDIPALQVDSEFFERMKRAEKAKESPIKEPTELVLNDYIEQAISCYNVEVATGVSLIQEYMAMRPYIGSRLGDPKALPILRIAINDHLVYSDQACINNYIEEVRLKYWTALFRNPKFVSQLTSNLSNMLYSKVNEMKAYEFSAFNIRQIMIEMNAKMVEGIHTTIMELFDNLTAKHAWYPACKDNIHYYNGWASNKAHRINSKVVLPGNAFQRYDDSFSVHSAYSLLADIEKALNYLDGHLTAEVRLSDVLEKAERDGCTKNIQCKFFVVSFYKKGTFHLRFTCPELLERFNIYCGKSRNWLPPDYGRKHYAQMDAEEQAVVDSFHGNDVRGTGATEYEKIYRQADYYLAAPVQCTPALPGTPPDVSSMA